MDSATQSVSKSSLAPPVTTTRPELAPEPVGVTKPIPDPAPPQQLEPAPNAQVVELVADPTISPASPGVPPAQDEIAWSTIAYELGLQGLAQEIAANSIVGSYAQDRLQLVLEPEIFDLLNPTIEQEITQAISAKLGVSLTLDWQAEGSMAVETPLQAKQRDLHQQRLAAIATIRQSGVVQKLQRAFGADLIEATVIKISD